MSNFIIKIESWSANTIKTFHVMLANLQRIIKMKKKKKNKNYNIRRKWYQKQKKRVEEDGEYFFWVFQRCVFFSY